MKKVLIILYYWPPAGGSAVQRWLKFSKYLREYGWEPIIYAPENARYPELDPGLEEEIPENITVLSRKVIEPIQYYKKFLGLKKEGKIGASMTLKSELTGLAKLKHRLAWWVRGNFFIPDAHFLWIKPSVRHLKDFLKDNKVDAMVTTGPPHSVHMIGYKLHKSLQIPWIADFRDPWTSIDFYAALNLSRFADRRHRKMEANVLHSADHVIAIGPNMKEEFLRLGAKNITVITNGFDESDISRKDIAPEPQFSLVHLGTFSASRNSAALWQVLSDKIKSDPQFSKDLVIRLVGGIDYTVLKDLESFNLQDHLSIKDFLPHQESMNMLKKSQVLLLLINNSVNSKGIITGKFFEYLAVGRPILLIGPLDGDAAKILNETGGGLAADFNDAGMIKKHIDYFYDMFRQNKLSVKSTSVSQYSRKALTGKLATVLNEVSSQA